MDDNLVLHTIILNKSKFKTKDDALQYAKLHFKEHLKNKKFVRETTNNFRVRVFPKQNFIKTTFVSKKINPFVVLVFGTPNEKYRGGAIDQKELKQFVDAGYKSKRDVKNIDDYELDNELSTRRDKVYVNKKTGKVVHSISGTDNLMDWSNNLLIPFGLHSKTNRYKNAEETQKKANEKYGKQNVSVVSHSQSGNIANTLDKRNLVGDENITLNPAIIGKTNAKVVKSYFDPVSYFTKTKKSDVVLKPSSINPLTEHSTKILEGKGRIDNQELYDKVKAYADTIYKKNSAYKSGFIQKLYKSEGGTYTNDGKMKPLQQWFKENWSDIGDGDYPVYRPTKKVNKKTPLTVSEIDPKNLKEQIKLKNIIKGSRNLPPFKPKKL